MHQLAQGPPLDDTQPPACSRGSSSNSSIGISGALESTASMEAGTAAAITAGYQSAAVNGGGRGRKGSSCGGSIESRGLVWIRNARTGSRCGWFPVVFACSQKQATQCCEQAGTDQHLAQPSMQPARRAAARLLPPSLPAMPQPTHCCPPPTPKSQTRIPAARLTNAAAARGALAP
jgi:hypothetical protein